MSDFRQRIDLIHELRELGRSEKLAHCGHDGLGVDQVVRHRAGHVLVGRHPVAHRSLHADQADAELVFQQLADRAHTPIAEVVDVVRGADLAPQLEQVADGRVEVAGIQHPAVQRSGLLLAVQLDVELHAPDARKVVLARVEEHVVEELRGGLARRRVARPQVAVDRQQGLVPGLDRILAQGFRKHRPALVGLREDHLEVLDPGLADPLHGLGGDGGIGLAPVEHFPALLVEDVVGEDGLVQVLGGARQVGDAICPHVLQQARVDLAALAAQRLAALAGDGRGQASVHQAFGNVALQGSRFVHADRVGAVELAQDVGVALEAEGAQEDRAQELALAIDTYVEQALPGRFLGIVLELDPAAARGDDLAEIVGVVGGRLEEYARRPVQLRNNHALGARDDKGALFGHQGDLAEEDLLLLDVPDGLLVTCPVLFEDGQPDVDLQGRGISHAAPLAFLGVVLELEPDRIAALVAERHLVRRSLAAFLAEDFRRPLRVGANDLPAVAAARAQVAQAALGAALAGPVADRVRHEFQRTHLSEVGDREHRLEDRFEAVFDSLVGQAVHLQEALVRLLLHVEQIRDRDRRMDLGEVPPLLCRAKRGSVRLLSHRFVHSCHVVATSGTACMCAPTAAHSPPRTRDSTQIRRDRPQAHRSALPAGRRGSDVLDRFSEPSLGKICPVGDSHPLA